MKMGHIVHKAGIKPTSLPFWASVLTITPPRLPYCHHYTHAHLFMWCFASEVSADYYTHPFGIVSLLMLTITYVGYVQ